ncbi:unnamed protein product, partial [Symbiodinium sp. CCMP2592]
MWTEQFYLFVRGHFRQTWPGGGVRRHIARSVQNVFKMLDDMQVAPINQTQTAGESDPDLLLKVVTKGADGSDIGTYAYRVTDKSVEVT